MQPLLRSRRRYLRFIGALGGRIHSIVVAKIMSQQYKPKNVTRTEVTGRTPLPLSCFNLLVALPLPLPLPLIPLLQYYSRIINVIFFMSHHPLVRSLCAMAHLPNSCRRNHKPSSSSSIAPSRPLATSCVLSDSSLSKLL